MTKRDITRKLIIYQLAGFSILLFLIVGDELFDFPHTIFGGLATPINRLEVGIETSYVLALCALTIYPSWRLLARIRYLEGLVPICQHCKKIRVGDEWKPVEEYISTHSAAQFSHGLCDSCLRRYYPKYAGKEK